MAKGCYSQAISFPPKQGQEVAVQVQSHCRGMMEGWMVPHPSRPSPRVGETVPVSFTIMCSRWEIVSASWRPG